MRCLLELNEIEVPRSLWPEGEVDELPLLVVFLDGSISAYGIAAYVQWTLKDGGFWSLLILAKSKIAPKRVTVSPRIRPCGLIIDFEILHGGLIEGSLFEGGGLLKIIISYMGAKTK